MRSSVSALVLLALLTACGADRPAPGPIATSTPPRPAGAGEEFLAFARGEAAWPGAAPVAVLFGGAPATTLTAAQAADPGAWRRVCDDAGAGYAMRECPIDALSYVQGPVTQGTEAVHEPCSRRHGLEPADVGAAGRISLVADGGGSCLDYAALELYIDDESQVVAVNLLLGSP